MPLRHRRRCCPCYCPPHSRGATRMDTGRQKFLVLQRATAEHSVTLPASPKIGKATPTNTSIVYYRVEQTDGPCWFRHTTHVGSPALDERTSPTAPRKLRSDCPLQIQQGVSCARSPSYSDSSGCAGAFWAESSCPFSSSSASGFPSYLPKSVCSCVLSGFGLNKK